MKRSLFHLCSIKAAQVALRADLKVRGCDPQRRIWRSPLDAAGTLRQDTQYECSDLLSGSAQCRNRVSSSRKSSVNEQREPTAFRADRVDCKCWNFVLCRQSYQWFHPDGIENFGNGNMGANRFYGILGSFSFAGIEETIEESFVCERSLRIFDDIRGLSAPDEHEGNHRLRQLHGGKGSASLREESSFVEKP